MCSSDLIDKHKRSESLIGNANTSRNIGSGLKKRHEGEFSARELFRSRALLKSPKPEDDISSRLSFVLPVQKSSFQELKTKIIKRMHDDRSQLGIEYSNTDLKECLPKSRFRLAAIPSSNKPIHTEESSMSLIEIKTELLKELKGLYSCKMENLRLKALEQKQQLKILRLRLAILDDQESLVTSIQDQLRANERNRQLIDSQTIECRILADEIEVAEQKINNQIDGIVLTEYEKMPVLEAIDFKRPPVKGIKSFKRFDLHARTNKIGKNILNIGNQGNPKIKEHLVLTTRSAIENSKPSTALTKSKFFLVQGSECRFSQQKKIDSASSFEKDSVFGQNYQSKHMILTQEVQNRGCKRRSTVFTQEPNKSKITNSPGSPRKLEPDNSIPQIKLLEGDSLTPELIYSKNDGLKISGFNLYVKNVLKGIKRLEKGTSELDKSRANQQKTLGVMSFIPLSPISERYMDTPLNHTSGKKPPINIVIEKSIKAETFGICISPPLVVNSHQPVIDAGVHASISPSNSSAVKAIEECENTTSKDMLPFSSNTLNDLKLLCGGVTPNKTFKHQGSIEDDFRFPNSKSIGPESFFLQPKPVENSPKLIKTLKSDSRVIQESKMTVISSRSSQNKMEFEETKNMEAQMHWLEMETPMRLKKKKTNKREDHVERKANYSMNVLPSSDTLADMTKCLAQGILKSIEILTKRPKSMENLLCKYDKRNIKTFETHYDESSSSDDMDEGYLTKVASRRESNRSTGANRRAQTRHTLANKPPSPLNKWKKDPSNDVTKNHGPTLSNLDIRSDFSIADKTANLRRSSEELSRNSDNKWLPKSTKSVSSAHKKAQEVRALAGESSPSRGNTSPSFSSRMKTTEYEFISYTSN